MPLFINLSFTKLFFYYNIYKKTINIIKTNNKESKEFEVKRRFKQKCIPIGLTLI